MHKFGRLALAVAAATTFAVASTAQAAYPEKPITLLVGFAAGGNIDTLARTLQPQLEKRLGAKIVVQNMPGAGSSVAYQHLSEQKGDGYIAAVNSAPSLLAPMQAGKRRYNVDSFTYIASLTDEPYTLFVNNKNPKTMKFQTIKDFIEAAKAKPGGILIGGAAIGSAPHIASIEITRVTGAKFTWVPFKGSSLAVAALEGGHVDAVISSVSMGVKLHKEGRASTIGMMQANRWDKAPEIPTFTESGYEVYRASHRGVMMPAGVPAEIVAKWDAAIADIHKDPAFLEAAAKRSMILSYIGHEEYTKYIKGQYGVYAALWKADPWLK
jgi:tripartite-type tricarboxylate transporter receptor subunit TctC